MLRCWHAFIGKLSREMRNLLDRLAKGGAQPVRRLKVETVMVREHQGTLHEVMMVPGGLLLATEDLSEPIHHRHAPEDPEFLHPWRAGSVAGRAFTLRAVASSLTSADNLPRIAISSASRRLPLKVNRLIGFSP
jgi:hypothetical protein